MRGVFGQWCLENYVWKQFEMKRLAVKLVVFTLSAVLSAPGALMYAHRASMLLFLSALLSPTASAWPIISLLIVQCLPTIGIWSNLDDWCVSLLHAGILKIEVISQNSAINTSQNRMHRALVTTFSLLPCVDAFRLWSYCIFYKEESVQF